jgi:hypothetical protein
VSDSTPVFFSAVYPEHFQCVFLLELETKCDVTKYETVAGVFQGVFVSFQIETGKLNILDLVTIIISRVKIFLIFSWSFPSYVSVFLKSSLCFIRKVNRYHYNAENVLVVRDNLSLLRKVTRRVQYINFLELTCYLT